MQNAFEEEEIDSDNGDERERCEECGRLTEHCDCEEVLAAARAAQARLALIARTRRPTEAEAAEACAAYAKAAAIFGSGCV